jgi:hypothetical protein
MPSFVTIVEINDRKDWAQVIFSDTTFQKTYRMTIDLPEADFINEAALLDFIATFWPYDFFKKPPRKPPKNKHLTAKIHAKLEKNITGRVTAGHR